MIDYIIATTILLVAPIATMKNKINCTTANARWNMMEEGYIGQ